MGGYAVKNLADVEDQAATHGLSPALESRFAREDLGAEQIGLSYQRIAPSQRQPFAHRHAGDEEVYVVIGGSGRALLGADVVEVRRFDAIRVSPETVRAFEAGPDGLELLAFGTHRPGDAEMQPPAWPD
jgi:uncharacterized cupin superfamily protein